METRKGRFTVAFSNFKLMQFDRKIFFDGVKARLDSTLEQEQVEGFNFLLDQIEKDPLWDDLRNIAYALATAWHETAFSMQPVEEGYYLEAQYSKAVMVKHQKSLRYYPYYGRGFVQLTWETRRIPNYSKATKKIREQKPELVEAFEDETGKTFDLVEHPEQAMHPLIAYAVLTLGMFQGWFTGKKLSDYINDEKRDFINARRIINGTDKAGPIARHADRFFEILLSAKQKDSAPDDTTSATKLAKDPTERPTEDFNTGADTNTAAVETDEAAAQATGEGTQTASAALPDGTKTESTSFNPQTIPQYIPKITEAKTWLGTLGIGGAVSTIGAWFAGLPDWLVFLLGFITGILFTTLASIIWKHATGVLKLVLKVADLNADPTQNNITLFGDKERYRTAVDTK